MTALNSIAERICAPVKRPASPCRYGVFFLACNFFFFAVTNAGAADAPRSQREAAVIEARNGGTQSGLAALRALLQKYPDDPRLLADTTIVASWAGDDKLSLDLYARRQTPKDDAGVVEAAARAARNLHQYDESIDLYRRAQTLEPARWQSRLGEAMVLTDRGDYAEAANLMQPLLSLHKDEKDVVLGQGYLCSRQADFACAIAMYQYQLEKSPHDMQTRTDLALALSQVGAQTYASTIYAKHVAPLELETERTLKAAAAGEAVNWGEAYAPLRARQRAESKTALAHLDEVIAASKSKDSVWRAAQFDRLVVLYDLHRSHDVVRRYRILRRQGVDVPEYALSNVAGAYLALRRPERAETLYRKLLAASPSDGNLWSGLAYAQMERGHARQALATIDRAYKAAAPWFRIEGMNEPKVNQMRLSLETQAAQMRIEANLLAEAQKRLERLAAAAPGNEEISRQLAAVYLARGWPSRALKESRIADSYASPEELPSLEGAEIHAAAGLRDKVDAMLPALRDRDFDGTPYTRFLRQERIEKGWQFTAESILGWGNGLQVGSSNQHSESYLYSPILDNRWRLYGHELRDSGDFGTGTAERTRASAGIRYNYNRQEAWGEFGRDVGANRYAGDVGASLSLNDLWTLRAEADSDSFDVPVRALTGNIHGRSVDVDVERRTSELSAAHAGLQRVLFSDGNQRAAVSAAWRQRVWTTPRWQTTLSAQGFSSANSLDENRPYFNPRHDFSLGPGGKVDWLTWQRYDRSFDQRIELNLAPYWQSNYGTHASLSLHYQQFWRLGPALKWHFGAAWNSQPYDGSKETGTSIDAGISWESQ